jgi:excisionase family DNA binding protein
VSSAIDVDSFRRDDDQRELIDAREVAQMLGMTTDWVYEQSRRGRIPTITLGRFRRYRRAAIEAWLQSIERANVDAGR